MARRTNSENMFKPIFDVMHDYGMISQKVFSLCMGKNGGYMQIGGYDGTGHLEEQIQWQSLIDNYNYLINLYGVSMNDHFIEGSEKYDVGFIDSGTTYTYLPKALFTMVRDHFQNWFCSNSQTKCQFNAKSKSKICFTYNQENLLDYYAQFPVLKFRMKNISGQLFEFKWFPSEYLVKDSESTYCVAAEIQSID